MSYQKEREEFIARMVAAFGESQLANIRLLLRHAKTHGNLAEAECNGPGDWVHRIPYPQAGEIIEAFEKRIEKRQEQIEKRIKAICEKIGCRVETGGDPRGYTIKVFLPNGAYNTWGGAESGWGVPQ